MLPRRRSSPSRRSWPWSWSWSWSEWPDEMALSPRPSHVAEPDRGRPRTARCGRRRVRSLRPRPRPRPRQS